MTENDVLRERIRKIADVIGRPVRIDSLEEELGKAKAEIERLRAVCTKLVMAADCQSMNQVYEATDMARDALARANA